MDSDSDQELEATASLARASNRGRAVIAKLEGDDESLFADENYDRVNEIVANGGIMSATAAERKQTPFHIHTLSAPTLSFTNPTSTTTLDTANIVPPPDKSGWMYKRGNLNSSWKKRWFTLKYQTLKYYKKSGDSKPKGFISLSAAVVTPGTSDKMRRLFGFEISSTKYSRVFIIHCESEAEMREWMECIQKNIDYVRQVIEREKRQNAGSNGGAGTTGGTGTDGSGQAASSAAAQSAKAGGGAKGSSNFAAVNGRKRLSPEQRLEFELSEDYLKHIGIPPRFSAWRRDVPRLGFDERSAKMVHCSSLKSSLRFPAASAYSVHNASNFVAVGLGSSQIDEVEKGGIQLLQVETRDLVSNISQLGRFGDLASAAADLPESAESQSASNAAITFPCNGEISALHWHDDKLFAGSSGGVVAMFKMPDSLSAQSLTDLQPTQLLHHPKVATVNLAAPGKWNHTSRITQVACNPVDRRTLLSIANQNFFVWDVERGLTTGSNFSSKPLLSEIGSASPLFAACWNPHGSSELMFGGEEGALRLLDSRLLQSGASGSDKTKCVPWFAKTAHTDVIRDIAWSPLVPHWVASAADDGLVKVWDLRFGTEPVRVLSGHTNAVTKVNWSKSHCEMLVSASSDKTTKVWNIRIAPHYAVYSHSATLEDFSSPLIYASFSPQNPFQTLVGSQSGEVVAMHFQKEFVSQYVNHRSLGTSTAAAPPPKEVAPMKKTESKENEEKTNSNDPDDNTSSAISTRTPADEALEREIETQLFLRDFDRAFKSVAMLANRYWQAGLHSFAENLLKLTSSSLFQAAAYEPSKPNSNNTMKSFNLLINDLSRFIPSNTLKVSKVDSLTHQRLQFLKTRLGVLKLIRAGKYNDILALDREICSHLERGGGVGTASSPAGGAPSPAAVLDASASSMDQFDSNTLEKMALAILPFDHIRGLEFCIRIAKTLKEAGNFSLFIGIARVVFFPTIFERMDETSTAAAQCSYIKAVSSLAHTPIGANLTNTHREESRSESESDTESSTNSVSSSTTPSRKPSDADAARPNLKSMGLRPSISLLGGSPQAAGGAGPGAVGSPSTTNARGSVMAGNEAQHASITLDRELRNPKIVLAQLTLLYQMLKALANDEDDASQAEPSTPTGPASTSNPVQSPPKGGKSGKGDDEAPVRFNPYLAKQHASIKVSIDTLGFPTIASPTAKEIVRLMEEHKEPTKLLPSLVHLLYFHSLIQQKKFDIVFISATKFGVNAVLKSYQLSNVLEGVMNEITTPRFVKFLERLLNKDSSSSGKSSNSSSAVGSNFNKLQAASLTIINMLFNCDYVPEKLSNVLPKFFRDFTLEMQSTLTEMRSNPEYVPSTSYSSARADVKGKVEGMLTQIARIKTHSKIVGGEPHHQDMIQDFTHMLKKFQQE